MKDLPASVLNSRLTLLSDEKCQAIYDAALSIIADIGMVVPHTVARELLVAAGASVGGEDLVRIPREMVAQADVAARGLGARVWPYEIRRSSSSARSRTSTSSPLSRALTPSSTMVAQKLHPTAMTVGSVASSSSARIWFTRSPMSTSGNTTESDTEL